MNARAATNERGRAPERDRQYEFKIIVPLSLDLEIVTRRDASAIRRGGLYLGSETLPMNAGTIPSYHGLITTRKDDRRVKMSRVLP